MNFFRIEDTDTRTGPYQLNDALWPDDEGRHPTPWVENLWDVDAYTTDPYYSEHTKYVCGFNSMAQLFDWFDPKMLDALTHPSSGRAYVMSRYTVHGRYARIGERQTVAQKEKLFLVEEFPIKTLLTMVQDYSKV